MDSGQFVFASNRDCAAALSVISYPLSVISYSDYSIAGLPVHPHIKLTREEFPRALATRMLDGDDAEYFGAFLNRTAVRILIDFLNRTFRLRSCDITIDGSFDVPCTQYYEKRCVGPCVSSLCDRERYAEIVQLARLFLRNDRELFLAGVTRKIDAAAESLDFEIAAYFRDILQNVEAYWNDPRRQVWLDDAVDTFEIDGDADSLRVIVVTQRGRRTLGELVYEFPARDDVVMPQAIADVIRQLYVYHLPREIRVPVDFEGRTALAKELGRKHGRKIAISLVTGSNRRVTTERAVAVTKNRLELQRSLRTRSTADIEQQLKGIFGLRRRPKRIEVFDVAHISATGFAAAVSVWQGGRNVPDDYEHWLSDQSSELTTLAAFVGVRVARTRPDLVVVDGGSSHLAAALNSLSPHDRPFVIAAVKPRGRHSSISHFLTEAGEKVDYTDDVAAFRLLHRLRDDAHDLANATHRLSRDMMHFYELAAILPMLDERERQQLFREIGSIRKILGLDQEFIQKRFGPDRGASIYAELSAIDHSQPPPARPLIVPIRYVEAEGSADDLIPIRWR